MPARAVGGVGAPCNLNKCQATRCLYQNFRASQARFDTARAKCLNTKERGLCDFIVGPPPNTDPDLLASGTALCSLNGTDTAPVFNQTTRRATRAGVSEDTCFRCCRPFGK